jgi:predicted nucleic-acid-binding protein
MERGTEVIGVDANVLLRLLTRDDEKEYEIARAFFDERSPDSPAFVSAVALAETAWVLRSAYKIPFDEVVVSLSLLVDSDDFVVEAGEAFKSLRNNGGKASQLTDFIVAQMGVRAGCRHTVTFDKRASTAVPSMELLQ